MINISNLLLAKCEELGPEGASAFFGTAPDLLSKQMDKGWKSPFVDAIQKVVNEHLVYNPTPPEVVDIQGKRIIILMPIYRALGGKTFYSLWRCFGQYGVDKIGMIPVMYTVVHEARNMLVQQFLATDSEIAIMGPDDDLVLPCGSAPITNGIFNAKLPDELAGLNAISRLMSHPMDRRVVGALYFTKGNPAWVRNPLAGRACCDAAFTSDDVNRTLHTPTATSGLVKCEKWVALGLARIHRSVFEDLAKATPGRWVDILPSHPGGHHGWFHPMGPDVNEDISFCRRCRAIGIDLWLDSGLVCGHSDGNTVYWHWNTI